MKTLRILPLLLFLTSSAFAGTRIESWISITNNPGYLTNVLSWNLVSNRVWTNVVGNPALQIMATNNIQNARTNLKVHLDTYRFKPWHSVQWGTNTNDIIYVGGTNEPLTIVVAGFWASVRYVTTTVWNADFVFAPPSPTASNDFLVWQWTAVATNLTKSTSFVQSLNFVSSTISNLSAPGTGADSVKVGASAEASGDNTVAFGASSAARAPAGTAIGNAAVVETTATNGIALGKNSIVDFAGDDGMALGTSSTVNGRRAVAIGNSSESSFNDAVAVGTLAITTKTNQVRLGTALSTVSVPGNIDVNGFSLSRSNVATNLVSPNVFLTGGTATNVSIVKAPSISGTVDTLNGGVSTNLAVTNSPFGYFSNLVALSGRLDGLFANNLTVTNLSAPGSGSGSTVIGSGTAAASGVSSVAIGVNAEATNDNAVALGVSSSAYGVLSSSLGSGSYAEGTNTVAVGSGSEAYGLSSFAIGGASALHNFSGALGSGAETTDTNQIRIGRDGIYVSIPGGVQDLVVSNALFTGTNVFEGDISFLRYDVSSLADANNFAVVFGTNTYIRLAGSLVNPVLVGITGGRDGKLYIIQNDLGATLTIASNAVDPSAANRFSLYLGQNVTVPAGGFLGIIYDTSATKWRPVFQWPQIATATNSTFFPDYIKFTPTTPSYERGKLAYSTNNGKDNLVMYNAEADIEGDILFESWVQVVNNYGMTITNGQAVAFNGSVSNGIPTVEPTAGTNFMLGRFVGFATHNIEHATIGYVTSFGEVNGLALTNGLTNGSTLYLHPTVRGAVTNSPPTNGVLTRVGFVAQSNATTGIVFTQPAPLVEVVGATLLDFPNTLAATMSDLPITVVGCTSNSIVTGFGVPWQSAAGGGSFGTFCSNDTVYVRFINQTALAINPTPGTFRVLVKPQF